MPDLAASSGGSVAATSDVLATRTSTSGNARPIDVSIIIVSYNTAHLLDRLFETLEAARRDLNIQVIVVENASRDSSAEMLRNRGSTIELIENSVNVGFGRANNQGLARSCGRYVLLLNTDAFVSPDTLTKTIAYMDSHPRCGVLGVKLVGSDDRLQPSCRYFPTPWNTFLGATGLSRHFLHARLVDDMAWDHASTRECDWVPGCYYLVRREVTEQVGLFDPRYFLYYEEVDHCRAVRHAGWSVEFFPFTKVIHLGGESAQSDGLLTGGGRQISALQIESELLYFRKHHGLAGVILSIVLTTLAETTRAAKKMGSSVKFNGDSASNMERVWLTVKCAALTRLGSRPTR